MELKFNDMVHPLLDKLRQEIKEKATRSEIMEQIDSLASRIKGAVEKTTNITMQTKQHLRKEMFNKVDLKRFNELIEQKA